MCSRINLKVKETQQKETYSFGLYFFLYVFKDSLKGKRNTQEGNIYFWFSFMKEKRNTARRKHIFGLVYFGRKKKLRQKETYIFVCTCSTIHSKEKETHQKETYIFGFPLQRLLRAGKYISQKYAKIEFFGLTAKQTIIGLINQINSLDRCMCTHENRFLSRVKLNQILIVIELFRLIWNQVDFRLVPYQSEKCKFNPNLFWITRFQFLGQLYIYFFTR